MPATRTTTPAALLAAIAAHPEEETPRAMFLDWLQEQPATRPCPICCGPGFARGFGAPGCTRCRGKLTRPSWESQWAEFIRVQCEREQIEAIEHTCRPDPLGGPIDDGETDCPACGACFDADDLRQREFDLLTALAERIAVPAVHAPWPGCSHDVNYDGRVVSVVGGMRNGAVVFRLGHVAEVQCDLAAWLARGKAIAASHPVEAVTLTDLAPALWESAAVLPGGSNQTGRYFWYAGGEVEIPNLADTEVRHWLPRAFCDRAIGTPDAARWRSSYFFGTPASAEAWLSDLAIAWAKSA